jgi:hypothetical protein
VALPLENGGKKHPTGKPPIHFGLRKACLVSYDSNGPIQVWKSVSTARENEAIQSQGSQRAGDSWSNEPPSTRTRKLLGNLARFRLPARASQRNGPSYGTGAMVTLANISSGKQPKA